MIQEGAWKAWKAILEIAQHAILTMQRTCSLRGGEVPKVLITSKKSTVGIAVGLAGVCPFEPLPDIDIRIDFTIKHTC